METRRHWTIECDALFKQTKLWSGLNIGGRVECGRIVKDRLIMRFRLALQLLICKVARGRKLVIVSISFGAFALEDRQAACLRVQNCR